MLCHRKSASRLSMGTSISCNMAIPGSFARNCSYYGRKLIAEAAFSRTSQFGIVAQGSAQAQAPALCASLGLHLPVSATGGGRFRPSATYTWAAARPPLKIIHWMIFRAFRPLRNINRRGCGPFDTSQGIVDSLSPCRIFPAGRLFSWGQLLGR